MSVERMRVVAAFKNRDHIRKKPHGNPMLLDMIEGTNHDIASALDTYAGLPEGFLGVVEREFGSARYDYARMPYSHAYNVFQGRVEGGRDVTAFLQLADTVKDMPLEYAQPVLDSM